MSIRSDVEEFGDTWRINQLADDVQRLTAQNQALADELKREIEAHAEAKHKLRVVETHRTDVWFWQGDKYDQPDSLSCPVVMEGLTLRDLVADQYAARELRDELSAWFTADNSGVSVPVIAPTADQFVSRYGRLLKILTTFLLNR